MPESPSEPENYSIDEMMDRLKNATSSNPEDGELVTRPDGTQAIRVRKRKRRSKQPAKKSDEVTRRVRIVQITTALVLVFILALVVGGAVAYANSRPFREALLGKIERSTGATVEIEQFRMNPKTANAVELNLKWPDGNVLKSLALGGLLAEVFPSSFLGNVMKGEEVSASEGLLMLQFPQSGDAIRQVPPAENSPIRFNRYRIPSLSVKLGPPATPVFSLVKSEASLNQKTVNGLAQLSLYRGDLLITGWPKLRLDRALIEFRGDETHVVGMRFLHESDSRGVCQLSGMIFPLDPQRLSSLDVSLESFEFSGITGPSLGRLISGRIDSDPAAKSNVFTFQTSEDSSPSLEVAFQANPSSRIELRGFPFLLGLAQFLDDPWFQSPVFESDAGGTIARQNGSLTLGNLNFESKGRMACRGRITLSNNQLLSGNLEIGIAEGMIASTRTPRLKAMFGPAKDGFRWITLKISGPVTAPTDDFKELFAAASTTGSADGSPPQTKESTFEELTRPK